LIAFNGAGGITLVDFGQPYPVNDAFRSNSIFSNSGFSGGIDLKGDGPTADDAGDPDDGPNHLQNFPVISSAVTANGITTISGTLNSAASTAFAIDLFASVVSTASNREGQFFLGSVPATTDVAGDASFNLGVSQPAPVPAGYLITVTATDPQGNTSEFAFPVAVTGTAAAQDIALSTSTASTGTPGATLSYIFPLKNLSASASGPLTFSDPLPAGLTFVSVTSSAGTAGNSGNNVTVSFTSMAANATASITVNATIDTGAPIDSYLVNRATVSTDRPDPNPFNNSAAVATLVQPILIITSMAHLPNGHIQLQGKGAPMRTHTIEASPDLSSGSFFALGTAMSDANGLLQFDDAGAAGESKQFYRLTFPDPFQPKAATTTRQVVGRTAGNNRAGLTRSPELVAPPGILNRQ
jgi:uncharacterized repeat protein (TIGR01451 family)